MCDLHHLRREKILKLDSSSLLNDLDFPMTYYQKFFLRKTVICTHVYGEEVNTTLFLRPQWLKLAVNEWCNNHYQ